MPIRTAKTAKSVKGRNTGVSFRKHCCAKKLTIRQEENFEAYNGTGNGGQTKPATGQNGGIEQ